MLIDGTGAPPAGPMNITVEGNRITAYHERRHSGRAAAGARAAVVPRPAARAADGTHVIDAHRACT